jgi:predicted membrane chloride channel (bestrophin family)
MVQSQYIRVTVIWDYFDTTDFTFAFTKQLVPLHTGFMLVFRTSISYYRFYEGKKYLGGAVESKLNLVD